MLIEKLLPLGWTNEFRYQIALLTDAILCVGVSFNLIDITQKGNSVREETKLSTASTTTRVEQTVSSIMGSRFLSGMTRVSVDLSLAIKSEGTWKLEGLVSKAPSLTARDGSVARDAQFFSINGRPVELPKVSRAIGEAWRAMEGTNKKRPACVLCVTLPNKEYDVNLSPDKREVLLTHEDAICSVVHEAVSKLWSSPDDGNFEKNGVQAPERYPAISPEHQPQNAVASDMSSPEASLGTRRKARRRNAFIHDPSMARLSNEDDDQLMMGSPAGPNGVPSLQRPAAATPHSHFHPAATQVARMSLQMLPHVQLARPSDGERVGWASVQSRFNRDIHGHQRDEIEVLASTREPWLSVSPITPDDPALEEDTMRLKQSSSEGALVASTSTAPKQTRTLTLEDFAFRPSGAAGKTARRDSSSELVENAAVPSAAATATVIESAKEPHIQVGGSYGRKRSVTPHTALDCAESRKRQKADDLSQVSVAASDEDEESDAARSVIQESEPEKTLAWNSFQGTDGIMKATKESRLFMRQFRKELRDVSIHSRRMGATENGVLVAGIDEADASDDANSPPEEASNVVSLSKEEFRHMTVIGQFNLGFILAKCRNNHLWILDQHACDEKYNFERLCATTKIHEQTLISPMPLELSPSEESCILDNMTVFEENGFRFAHYPDKPPRHRLALTALPHSGTQEGRKAVQFGKDDVHALCAMLTSEEGYSHDGGTGVDGSGMYGNNAVRRHAGVSQSQDKADRVIARLPKAVAMFASRACRGSIMIGTALSQKEMEAVVKRLADLGQPWNCPHGRPTMRHVKDLTEIMMHDEQCASAHVAGPTMAVMTQEEVED